MSLTLSIPVAALSTLAGVVIYCASVRGCKCKKCSLKKSCHCKIKCKHICCICCKKRTFVLRGSNNVLKHDKKEKVKFVGPNAVYNVNYRPFLNTSTSSQSELNTTTQSTVSPQVTSNQSSRIESNTTAHSSVTPQDTSYQSTSTSFGPPNTTNQSTNSENTTPLSAVNQQVSSNQSTSTSVTLPNTTNSYPIKPIPSVSSFITAPSFHQSSISSPTPPIITDQSNNSDANGNLNNDDASTETVIFDAETVAKTFQDSSLTSSSLADASFTSTQPILETSLTTSGTKTIASTIAKNKVLSSFMKQVRKNYNQFQLKNRQTQKTLPNSSLTEMYKTPDNESNSTTSKGGSPAYESNPYGAKGKPSNIEVSDTSVAAKGKPLIIEASDTALGAKGKPSIIEASYTAINSTSVVDSECPAASPLHSTSMDITNDVLNSTTVSLPSSISNWSQNIAEMIPLCDLPISPIHSSTLKKSSQATSDSNYDTARNSFLVAADIHRDDTGSNHTSLPYISISIEGNETIDVENSQQRGCDENSCPQPSTGCPQPSTENNCLPQASPQASNEARYENSEPHVKPAQISQSSHDSVIVIDRMVQVSLDSNLDDNSTEETPSSSSNVTEQENSSVQAPVQETFPESPRAVTRTSTRTIKPVSYKGMCK